MTARRLGALVSALLVLAVVWHIPAPAEAAAGARPSGV